MKKIKKKFFSFYKKNLIDYYTDGFKGKFFYKLENTEDKKKYSFGNSNKKKKFLIIRVTPGGGFFSIFFSILYSFHKAKRTNKIPFVDLENFHTKYNESSKINNTYNSWEYYFKNLSNYKLKNIYKSKNVFFSKKSIDTRQFLNFNTIKRIRKFVIKNIKINKKILHQTEKIYTRKFKNNKIIGVHFRGSDMKYTPNHSFPPSFHQITKSIDQLLLKNNNQKIFLITEDKNNLNLMKKKYSKKLVYLNSFRTNDNKLFSHNIRKNHRYKLGKEILIETLLLSRCDQIISSRTNVFFAALLFANKPKKIIFHENGVNSSNIFLSMILWKLKKFSLSNLFGIQNYKIFKI